MTDCTTNHRLYHLREQVTPQPGSKMLSDQTIHAGCMLLDGVAQCSLSHRHECSICLSLLRTCLYRISWAGWQCSSPAAKASEATPMLDCSFPIRSGSGTGSPAFMSACDGMPEKDNEELNSSLSLYAGPAIAGWQNALLVSTSLGNHNLIIAPTVCKLTALLQQVR